MNTATTLTLPIEGMTCASCVKRVERALAKVPGVVQASVNLATAQAHVTTQPGVLPAALQQAVAAAGYEPGAVHDDAAEQDLQAEAERRSRRAAAHRIEGLELLAGIALSLPLLLPMLGDLLGRHWMLPAAWQFALATPVQFWLGARFFRAGWKAVRAGSANMDLLVALGTSAAYAERERRKKAALGQPFVTRELPRAQRKDGSFTVRNSPGKDDRYSAIAFNSPRVNCLTCAPMMALLRPT